MSFLKQKKGDSLVHLGVERPDGVTQMHSSIKQHFHIEQVVNAYIIKALFTPTLSGRETHQNSLSYPEDFVGEGLALQE